MLLETADGVETGPITTAAALHAVAAAGAFDLVLLGNEASDTGDYQVGVRLAHLLGRPVSPDLFGGATTPVPIDYAGPAGTVPYISYSRVYAGKFPGEPVRLPGVVHGAWGGGGSEPGSRNG